MKKLKKLKKKNIIKNIASIFIGASKDTLTEREHYITKLLTNHNYLRTYEVTQNNHGVPIGTKFTTAGLEKGKVKK